MAASSTIQLRGTFSSLGAGSRSIALIDQTNSNAPSHVIRIILGTLAGNNNIILIPPNARGCIISFSSTSTTVKTLRGSTFDVGVDLDPTGWNVLKFAATPPASFVIHSSASDVNKYTEITFF